jgi:Undecaprenyl-phosphate glucose phosphotransferase
MIGDRPRLWRRVQFLGDLSIVATAWLIAYPIRFYLLPLRVQHVPPFSRYGWLAALAVLVWAAAFRWSLRLGRKTRDDFAQRLWLDLQGYFVGLVAFVVLTFLVSEYKPSRVVLLLFTVFSVGGLIAFHVALNRWETARREKGIGVVRCLMVGAGPLGQSVVQRLRLRPDLGQEMIGYVAEQPELVGTTVDGLPVLAGIEAVRGVTEQHAVQRAYVALPMDAHEQLRRTLNELAEEVVDVKVIVDLRDFVVFGSAIEDLEGLPVISLKQTPLSGAAVAFKRAFDLAFSGAVIVLGFPALLAIAIAIKLSSPGPIFYRQSRMGLDGTVFDIYKFRSMRSDAEADSGAVWAVQDDPRRTRVGAFLRQTNLDELPQFWNVLRGDMSVVGPRPERPVFIEQFRKEIPKYMLRHKAKAGLTGWAQVNGWRGNTDLRRRIECDLYYIENWSFRLDLRIIWMTLFSRKARQNAY